MKPEIKATRSASGRILECHMTGLFSETDMLAAAREMRRQTDAMQGKRHIVVADMRGMKTVHPSIARHMGEAIGYQRERGCVLCVHVSDDTVQRLQARRLAREHSPNDDVTIEADSIEEARKIAKAYETHVDDPSYSGSIRAAIPLAAS
jgi:dihydroorotase-like cyclic amidohydrolase